MKEKIRLVFINSCISTHRSRTRQLCEAWLEIFREKHHEALIDEIDLSQVHISPLDKTAILHRNDLIEEEAWEDPMFDLARRVKAADEILVGAPYWDCSFPSILKVFIENIVVTGLTFQETPFGYEGLCPAQRLTYITTAGGPIGDLDLGYDYLRGIGRMLGIEEFREYRVEGLDIQGADVQALMTAGLEDILKGEQ